MDLPGAINYVMPGLRKQLWACAMGIFKAETIWTACWPKLRRKNVFNHRLSQGSQNRGGRHPL